MATIAGEFNILDLPNSLQSFLHKYYPSYIAAPASTPKNQEFVFNLNTNYIDPYLKLFDKKLSGLNDINIEGSINTKQNQFQVLLQIPYFKYDTYSFTGIDLKGNGNLDSLVLVGSVTSTQLNDSFYLPTSKLIITSSNDHSIVSINTKANNTLNDASILADVYTLNDGIRLQFRPSSFVINEKKWNIDTNQIQCAIMPATYEFYWNTSAEEFFERVTLLDITDLVLTVVESYPREITLKTSDAIHVATAGLILEEGDSLATFDKQMATNAERLGIPVLTFS
jgi:hypothetical protein